MSHEYYAEGPYGIVVITEEDISKHPEWMYFVEKLNEKLDEAERTVSHDVEDLRPF